MSPADRVGKEDNKSKRGWGWNEDKQKINVEYRQAGVVSVATYLLDAQLSWY